MEFLVEDPVDLAHTAFSELLDDLVAVGEHRAGGEFLLGSFDGFREGGLGFRLGDQLSSALSAVLRPFRILVLTVWALQYRIPLSVVGLRISISGTASQPFYPLVLIPPETLQDASWGLEL